MEFQEFRYSDGITLAVNLYLQFWHFIPADVNPGEPAGERDAIRTELVGGQILEDGQ